MTRSHVLGLKVMVQGAAHGTGYLDDSEPHPSTRRVGIHLFPIQGSSCDDYFPSSDPDEKTKPQEVV